MWCNVKARKRRFLTNRKNKEITEKYSSMRAVRKYIACRKIKWLLHYSIRIIKLSTINVENTPTSIYVWFKFCLIKWLNVMLGLDRKSANWFISAKRGLTSSKLHFFSIQLHLHRAMRLVYIKRKVACRCFKHLHYKSRLWYPEPA